MKILSLHVDGFGRLSDFKYQLSEGLNVLDAENGFGKTTLASFIKAMLYGLQSQNSRGKVENNDRVHYAPWQGGPFGGSLDIETAKGRFRIIRSFGQKSSLDKFSLIDLDSGLESNEYSENIGVELFGLDASSYEKSTYVPQNDPVLVMASDINARLTGLLQSSDDMGEYDRAISRIEDYMRRFKRLTGDAGLIQDTQRELDGIIGRISDRERSLEQATSYRAELARLEAELDSLEKDDSELQTYLKEAGERRIARQEYETYLAYRRSADREKERLDSLRSRFKNGVPTSTELNELSALCSKYEGSMNSVVGMSYADETELAALADRFGDQPISESDSRWFANELQEIKSLESSLTPLPPKPDPFVIRKNKTLLVSGIADLVVGTALTVAGLSAPTAIWSALGVVACISAIAALVFSFLSLRRNNTEQKRSEERIADYERLSDEFDRKRTECASRRASLESELSAYYPALPGGIDAAVYRLEGDRSRYSLLLSARERYNEERRAKRTENQKLLDDIHHAFESYGFEKSEELRETLDSIKSIVHDIWDCESRLADAQKLAEDYRAEKRIDGEPPVQADTTETSDKLDAIRARADKVRVRIGVLTEARDNAEYHAQSLPTLRDEAEALRTKIAEYTSCREVADRARNLLQSAKIALSSRYLKDMQESFSENFSTLIGKAAPEAIINTNLGVSFRELGGQRERSWYSSGQQAAISLSLRLALIDSIFEDERPFLVLDDPFTDLDAEKMQNAAQMLRSLAEKLQIIYFTCHSSRNIS